MIKIQTIIDNIMEQFFPCSWKECVVSLIVYTYSKRKKFSLQTFFFFFFFFCDLIDELIKFTHLQNILVGFIFDLPIRIVEKFTELTYYYY